MGRGLPNWTRDERILALDLYLRLGIVDDKDPEAIEASRIMRRLPRTGPSPSDPSFRNPNTVAMKTANFAFLDPKYKGGLPKVASGDIAVWDELGSDPAKRWLGWQRRYGLARSRDGQGPPIVSAMETVAELANGDYARVQGSVILGQLQGRKLVFPTYRQAEKVKESPGQVELFRT